MNETLQTIDERPLLRIERQLGHSQKKVWQAITEPEQLGVWYPFKATSMDFRAGGAIQFDDGDGTTYQATIVEIDPPRVFAFSESPPKQMTRESADLIHIELHPNNAGCSMIFTHTFTDRPAAASYGTGWRGCLNALEQQLAGKEWQPELDGISYHEQLVHRFGLDEGTLDVTADGGIIRFARQLMRQPIEKFWAASVGERDPVVGRAVPSALVPDGINAGTVSEVEHDKLIAFDWLNDGHPAGSVRWELSAGPGGVRIDLTQTGTGDSPEFLDLWKAHLEQLVRRVIAVAWSENR